MFRVKNISDHCVAFFDGGHVSLAPGAECELGPAYARELEHHSGAGDLEVEPIDLDPITEDKPFADTVDPEDEPEADLEE